MSHTWLMSHSDFIYSGEIPSTSETSQLLDAARFLQMKDLISRLEKFESDLAQLRNLQPEVLLQFFQQKNKRKRPSKTNHNNNRLNMQPLGNNGLLGHVNDNIPLDKILKIENRNESADEIQIEEINSINEDEDESPPAKHPNLGLIPKNEINEIQVKVQLDTKPSPPIQGSSRRKGTSQVMTHSMTHRV